MADNAQKTPLARSLNRFAEQKILDAMQLLGQQLPASVKAVAGSIVTVNFEVNAAPFTLPTVTIPLFGPEYIRYPIQIGDKGFVVAADAYLDGMSGLGAGLTDLSMPANLAALVFFPIGNKTWSAPTNPNALELYGPDGVVLRDAQKRTIITLTPDGITITLPAGKAVTINGNVVLSGDLQIGGTIKAADGATYAGNLETTGNVVAGAGGADQVGLQTHRHTSGTAGNPTSAPTGGT